jgi:hypothetical protein
MTRSRLVRDAGGLCAVALALAGGLAAGPVGASAGQVGAAASREGAPAGQVGVAASRAGAAASLRSAAESAPVVKRHEETVSLPPAAVTTVDVVYPDALEFGGATYSGKVKILGPNPEVGGRRPRLSLIDVLSKGSAEGDSVYRVRIRNANPRGTLSARAEITAITREPR